jgi:ABC-2 type transport system permease protein
MNGPSNAIPGPPAESRAAAPVNIPATRRVYWSLRRELWESRSIYLAPLAAAGLAVVGFLISTGHLRSKVRGALALGGMQGHAAIQQPYTFAALLMMLTFLIVAVFYCLDALHGERRDRSILFWKSLPVSDLTTVLVKASVPIVILPLLTFALTVATQWVMLVISSVVMVGSGVSFATLSSHVPLVHMWLMLLNHVVGVHGLWYAPFYCWLLLVSAWARRAPILWATLPLLAIGIVERIAFNTSHFAELLQYRFTGGTEGAAFMADSMKMDPLTGLSPIHFLTSAGLWGGFLFAATFLAGAIWLRRSREPM